MPGNKVAGESEFGGVGGLLTPPEKGNPMRPEWEQLVADYAVDPMDDGSGNA